MYVCVFVCVSVCVCVLASVGVCAYVRRKYLGDEQPNMPSSSHQNMKLLDLTRLISHPQKSQTFGKFITHSCDKQEGCTRTRELFDWYWCPKHTKCDHIFLFSMGKTGNLPLPRKHSHTSVAKTRANAPPWTLNLMKRPSMTALDFLR